MDAKIYSCEYWITETNPKILFDTYKQNLYSAGFKIINILEHHFTPIGYTAIFLLAESHFAIHTFPEKNKTYLQLSSCNKEMFDKFLIIEKNKDKKCY